MVCPTHIWRYIKHSWWILTFRLRTFSSEPSTPNTMCYYSNYYGGLGCGYGCGHGCGYGRYGYGCCHPPFSGSYWPFGFYWETSRNTPGFVFVFSQLHFLSSLWNSDHLIRGYLRRREQFKFYIHFSWIKSSGISCFIK